MGAFGLSKVKPVVDIKPVLAWVNDERSRKGISAIRKLHKGARRSFRECPVALSLNGPKMEHQVASWGWRLVQEKDEEGKSIGTPDPWEPLPEEVSDFIRRFDTEDILKEYRK